MKKRLYATFSGRVQGVGFRATCRRLAIRRGLTGWVRNLDDGDVRLEAQGEADALEAFLSDVRAGPVGAGIQNEQVDWREPTPGEDEFEIRL